MGNLDLGPLSPLRHLLSLLKGNSRERTTSKDVPRTRLRNSVGAGVGGAGNHRGRRGVDGQKAQGCISTVPAPPTRFSSFLSAGVHGTSTHWGREGSIPPTNGKLESHGKGKYRTAAWGGAPRPHFKTQHHFHHLGNKHYAGNENAGWWGASKCSTKISVNAGICVYTLQNSHHISLGACLFIYLTMFLHLHL